MEEKGFLEKNLAILPGLALMIGTLLCAAHLRGTLDEGTLLYSGRKAGWSKF